jgi:hypothetical protein
MEFFYVVKATQKSGKEDAVIWFTAKSEARANLQLDVELEDAVLKLAVARTIRSRFVPISQYITTFLMKAPLIIHGANATSWTKTSVHGKLNCWRVTRSMVKPLSLML